MCLVGDCKEIAIMADSDGFILEDLVDKSDVDVSEI
jgi:hypothetical protein